MSTLKGNVSLISRMVAVTTHVRFAHHSCKILVVGGGCGGCTMAAKLSKKFNQAPNHVIVVEPNEEHYYQPLFTLIGGGIKPLEASRRPMKDVLPQKAQWIKDRLSSFQPHDSRVTTSSGDTIQYEMMIVAIGLELYWNQVPGLLEGLSKTENQVCSIYGSDTVSQVYDRISKTKEGTAVFTFPNTPVKCPGAPQKIVYLAEDYWSKQKKRDGIKIVYNTSLPVIFGVKKYADALWNVCKQRNIQVNVRTNLIEIRPKTKEAVFQDLDKPEKTFTLNYSLLHVTPPMGTPEILKNQKELTNAAGFLDVDPKTLQHKVFKNVFGLGDCTSTPNSKTMAAIASQSQVLYRNILDYSTSKDMKMSYDGYASCPLVTGYGKCILAEFNYELKPKETFPVNQGKEMYFTYLLKEYFFPFLYWNFMLKGNWNGPETFRKIFSVFKRKDTLYEAAK